MEGAIAAFAFACNVVQIVESSLQAVTVIRQVYKDGASSDNAELNTTSKQLRNLSGNLELSLKTCPTPPKDDENARELHDMAVSCKQKAEELCKELDKIKADGSRRSAIWKGIRTVWKKGDIEKLQKDLQSYERRLNTGLLIVLRDQNKAAALAQASNFNTLDTTLQQFIRDLADGHTKQSALIASEHTTTRQAVTVARRQLGDQISTEFDKIRLTDLRTKILKSLRYPEMNARINQITDAEEDTFQWIFDDNLSSTRNSFPQWLSSDDDRIYWIQGKAGSGKSTLMKFIWQNQYTRTFLLQNRISSEEPIVLKFGFWLSGSQLQRSLTGLLCTLLHQLISYAKDTVVMESLLKTYPEIDEKVAMDDWSVRELTRLLCVTLQETQARILILLDGLDELCGSENPLDLRKLLDRLRCAANTKICVSSRPEQSWPVFLANELTLRLQDHTLNDIRTFVQEQLQDARSNGLLPYAPRRAETNLISTIADKAEGVFLWVRLAVRFVLKGLSSYDSWDDLAARVSQLPPGIEKLYEDMLSRVTEDSDQVRKEVALYLRMCLTWQLLAPLSRLSILECVIARCRWKRSRLNKDLETQKSILVDECCCLVKRLPNICSGLIEIKRARDMYGGAIRQRDPGFHWDDADQLFSSHVLTFSHRTVHDFFTDTPQGTRFLDIVPLRDGDLLYVDIYSRMLLNIHGITKFDWQSVEIMVYRVICFSHETEVAENEVNNTLDLVERHVSRSVAVKMNYAPESEPLGHQADRMRQDQWIAATSPEFDSRARIMRFRRPADVLGYSLYHGSTTYFEHKFRGHKLNTITSRYRRYLLACAVYRDASSKPSQAMFKLIRKLLKCGTEPELEYFSTTSQRLKQTPLLDLAYSRLTPVVSASAKHSKYRGVQDFDLIQNILDATKSTTHFGWFSLRIGSTLPRSSFDSELGMLHRGLGTPNFVIVEINLIDYLRIYLQMSDGRRIDEELPKRGQQFDDAIRSLSKRIVMICHAGTIGVPSTQEATRLLARLDDLRPSFEDDQLMFRYWDRKWSLSESPQLLPHEENKKTEREDMWMEELYHVMSLESTRILKNDFKSWKDGGDLVGERHDEVLGECKDTLTDYLVKAGYCKHPSDPEVLKGPIPIFEEKSGL